MLLSTSVLNQEAIPLALTPHAFYNFLNFVLFFSRDISQASHESSCLGLMSATMTGCVPRSYIHHCALEFREVKGGL